MALILAGGKGERLWPLTLTRPKALLEVGGRPLLAYILEAIRAAGIREAVKVDGVVGITAGNYGGRLGKYLIYLKECLGVEA